MHSYRANVKVIIDDDILEELIGGKNHLLVS